MELVIIGAKLNGIDEMQPLIQALIDNTPFTLPVFGNSCVRRTTPATLQQIAFCADEYNFAPVVNTLLCVTQERARGLFVIPDYENYNEPTVIFGKIVCTQSNTITATHDAKITQIVSTEIDLLYFYTQSLPETIRSRYTTHCVNFSFETQNSATYALYTHSVRNVATNQ